MTTAPTFCKQERMVSNKLIEQLFGGVNSRSVAVYPLRAVYAVTERQPAQAAAQVLISVPKKRFKHAVDRNRVKRQVREAYRHHKQLLLDAVPAGKCLLVAFVWLSDRHSPTAQVESKVTHLLRRIAQKP